MSGVINDGDERSSNNSGCSDTMCIHDQVSSFTFADQFDEEQILKERAMFTQLYNSELPSFVNMFIHPYSISVMIGIFSIMAYYAINLPLTSNPLSNFYKGFFAALTVYLLICACNLRDTLLVRPHPVFWRMIKGLAYAYMLFTVWLLFQNAAEARHFFSYIDSSLGVELVDVSYADDCSLTTLEPVYNAVFDTFMLSHLIGWFCKAIMLRDKRLVFVSSILFELYELTFKHMLANFKECWWDSLILDLILANGAGMLLGFWFMDIFQLEKYNWMGMTTDENGRSVWKPLRSLRDYIGLLSTFGLLAVIELNAFFLKHALWIPPPHMLNLGRVIFWWLLGCAGTREYYHYVQHRNVPFGMMAALLYILSGLEILVNIKFGTGMYPIPMPSHIFYAWITVFVFLTVFAVVFFSRKYLRSLKDANKRREMILHQQQKQRAAEGAQ